RVHLRRDLRDQPRQLLAELALELLERGRIPDAAQRDGDVRIARERGGSPPKLFLAADVRARVERGEQRLAAPERRGRAVRVLEEERGGEGRRAERVARDFSG